MENANFTGSPEKSVPCLGFFSPLIDIFTLRFEILLTFCDVDADLIDFLVKCI